MANSSSLSRYILSICCLMKADIFHFYMKIISMQYYKIYLARKRKVAVIKVIKIKKKSNEIAYVIIKKQFNKWIYLK